MFFHKIKPNDDKISDIEFNSTDTEWQFKI